MRVVSPDVDYGMKSISWPYNFQFMRFPQGMPHTLILLSPLVTHGGNFCTINRIKSHLECQGFPCHLADPNDCTNESIFQHGGATGENVGVLVGIHALKTGAFMRGQKLPYILIIGGTDINVFCDEPKAMTVMTEAVLNARYVICFSKANKERTLKLWPKTLPSRIKVIPQGVVYVPGLPICDVHALISQATALVNSSDSEGMCLALLEAMQLGTPVIARDIPGNRAIVQDGHTGLLFDSPESFREKTEHLLEDSSLQKLLTREAAEYVDSHHNIQQERQEYTNLLDQCLRDLHKQRQMNV
ncbi:glycosyltransferase 1 domain-containing protein 1 [Plakobranchus ocellatus]|uniref:Glycosyltransferase 1 domain-containing protein 1 n=1 Tax=Plakobranchus ocellatus TaxID=259542 RepID=A0AAV3Y341_9GAST|nr:glycosyltransferase 1 domain-containing protein 1 [Plakobranchus ocellatus]